MKNYLFLFPDEFFVRKSYLQNVDCDSMVPYVYCGTCATRVGTKIDSRRYHFYTLALLELKPVFVRTRLGTQLMMEARFLSGTHRRIPVEIESNFSEDNSSGDASNDTLSVGGTSVILQSGVGSAENVSPGCDATQEIPVENSLVRPIGEASSSAVEIPFIDFVSANIMSDRQLEDFLGSFDANPQENANAVATTDEDVNM